MKSEKNLGIGAMDRETLALIRTNSPKQNLPVIDVGGRQENKVRNNLLPSGNLREYLPSEVYYCGIELPYHSPVVHSVAHHKTWRERYGVDSYKELRRNRA